MKSEESRSWNRIGPQRLDFLLSEMECLWKCWMKRTSDLPTLLKNIVCGVCDIGEVIEGWWINPFLKVGKECLRRRLWKARRKDIPSRGRAGLRGWVMWCFSMKCEDWPWTVLRLEKVHVCHSESLGFSPRMWWSHIESKGAAGSSVERWLPWWNGGSVMAEQAWGAGGKWWSWWPWPLPVGVDGRGKINACV